MKAEHWLTNVLLFHGYETNTLQRGFPLRTFGSNEVKLQHGLSHQAFFRNDNNLQPLKNPTNRDFEMKKN